MAIKIKYTARGDKIEGTRFVRACYPSGYAWIIRSIADKRYDLQQGTCDAEDLPVIIKESADRLLGYAFGYVEWPQ